MEAKCQGIASRKPTRTRFLAGPRNKEELAVNLGAIYHREGKKLSYDLAV